MLKVCVFTPILETRTTEIKFQTQSESGGVTELRPKASLLDSKFRSFHHLRATDKIYGHKLEKIQS